MKTRKYYILTIVVVACFFVIVAYYVGRRVGEHSVEIILREQDLVFQKEKETARKVEFAKLLRIYEEEKRAAEEYKRQQRLDKLNLDVMNMLNETEKRKADIIMKLMDYLKNPPSPPIMGSPFDK